MDGERRRPASSPARQLELVLYTRPGCHLCEDMKHAIEAAGAGGRFHLREVDIDTDPALVALYGLSIPVLTIAGRVAFKGRLTRDEFLKKLARAQASCQAG
jgi:thioredoxin-like negative regulator of GroEL